MNDIAIVRWTDVTDKAATRAQIETIFFEASATKSFNDAPTREKFLDRWLGRYIKHYPREFYVAQTYATNKRPGAIAGYLAGCTKDPRRNEHFADITYFSQFARHLDAYPAHLHINLGPAFRNKGIGAYLIQVFLNDASKAHCQGVHVVTGANSRNISFYNRNGFQTVQTLDANGAQLAFLGAKL